jgi:hypothetical protein
MFCLSWLITWYGHVLSDFKHIVRLYDFFMACHPLMPIYLAAQVSYSLLAFFKLLQEEPSLYGVIKRVWSE